MGEELAQLCRDSSPRDHFETVIPVYFHGMLERMNSAEAGPAFQVALSLGACIYFLNDKNKSLPRAAIIGFVALVGGWFCGSVAVPLIPSFLLQPTWTVELLTSLVVYVLLFLACSFLK